MYSNRDSGSSDAAINVTGVLNDKDIKRCCEEIRPSLIYPWNPKYTKPAGYELHVGNEYRLSFDKEPKRLKENGIILLPPNELCYIITDEDINMPHNICGMIFPKQSRVLRGILMYPQPPIQPGSSGKLYVLLHNLSNKEVEIRKGEHLATLVLIGMCAEAAIAYGSRDGDKYQNKKTLMDLGVTDVYRPSLKEIRDRVDSLYGFREQLILRYYPIILAILTVFITVLSILFFLRTP